MKFPSALVVCINLASKAASYFMLPLPSLSVLPSSKLAALLLSGFVGS